MNMFRVEYLKLKNHPQLGEIELFLSDIGELDNVKKPYTSVIIGPNGTGKSFILRTIAEIFINLEILKTNKKSITSYFNYEFHIRYHLNGNNYDIQIKYHLLNDRKMSKMIGFYLNNNIKEIFDLSPSEKKISKFEISIDKLELPSQVIVNSVMLNDRFLFKNNKPTDFYQYLGIRTSASSASTKSAIRGTLNQIFNEKSINVNFNDNLSRLLEFLNFENNFEVQYNTKISKLFFSGKLNIEGFRQYFEYWWDEKFPFSKRAQHNPIWSKPYYDNFIKNDVVKINTLINYLNRTVNEGKLKRKPYSRSNILSIDLFSKEISIAELEIISILEKLDIINVNGIILNKKNSELSFEQLSSGEYHLLISLIGIFSKIKENGLVLIDEPEISLHPNWQMQYISFLKKVFSEYPSCQFIVTSHSHFIISDLEGYNSSVTSLNRNSESRIESSLIKADTFGWSAEEILLKVFKVNTSRNYFVADKLGELLDYISDEVTDEKSIRDKFYELGIDKLSSLSDNDPLKVVYNTIVKEYVSNQS